VSTGTPEGTWVGEAWGDCSAYCPLSTGISFTPKEVGEHVVSVRKSGKHVTNSPFKILVGPSEIGDASKVRVWGKGLSEGQTFQVAEFIVDTRNAGTFSSQNPPSS
jgi:MinD superfamily P-loop ATPase